MKKEYIVKSPDRNGHSAYILFTPTKMPDPAININDRDWASNFSKILHDMEYTTGLLSSHFNIKLEESVVFTRGTLCKSFNIFIQSCEMTFNGISLDNINTLPKTVERFAHKIVKELGYEGDFKIIINRNNYESTISKFSIEKKEN